MRFKAGIVIGFGVGYYLGSMAGRERYEQINTWLGRATDSDAFETATEKARAVVDLTVERARDLIDEGADTSPAGVAADPRVSQPGL